jgi:hypothetical protein
MHSPAQTPIDELDHNILTLCQRINVATYELLVLIREFDERGGWVQWGSSNCAEWLAWRCDLSIATAREKVRVARALKTLPLICEAFATGELSYAKVRAMTRVAHRDNEQALVEFALWHTATHVADRCRELRCGSEASIDTAARAYAGRSLRIRRDRQREMMTITIDLPVDTGELVEKALDKAREGQLSNQGDIPDIEDASWSTRQADAFVGVVTGFLSGDGHGDDKDTSASNDNYLVTIHVDQSALAGNDGRSAIPIESVRRLCCDSHAVVLTEGQDGEPLSIGRKTRIIPQAIARAVRARDGHQCTFPGCSHRRYLHCHHVKHWSKGGETSLDNLLLICSKHHTLVHEGGFNIERDYANNWFFKRPDGIAVPDIGYISRPYQNPPAGGLLSVAENMLKEQPPPVYLH